MSDDLSWIKQQKWFYEFELPDGTRTESSEQPHIRQIHFTREKVLRGVLDRIPAPLGSAVDLACHEGFFSLVMGERFARVVGIDKNEVSLGRARRMAAALGRDNVQFEHVAVEELDSDRSFDFVLCYGLLYHSENPVRMLRSVATLARKATCIETQVLPFEMSGRVEDGSYRSQRDLRGTFGLCADYMHSTKGGMTNLALVPSIGALMFLLHEVGFRTVQLYQAALDDYEQFVRGSRVIVYAEK